MEVGWVVTCLWAMLAWGRSRKAVRLGHGGVDAWTGQIGRKWRKEDGSIVAVRSDVDWE